MNFQLFIFNFQLNRDSFKYRNYDYAIGRFMSVDPLAEKYAYNSTYAFQENKMGLGRELEGLEIYPGPNPWLNTSQSHRHVLNLKIKTGTGVMWSKNASTRNSNNMTADEKARSNDHQPWYIDMDNGFNLMLSNYRPSGFPDKVSGSSENVTKTTNKLLKGKDIAKRGEKASNVAREGAKMLTGQTGNTDTTQNAGNNTSSGDNATGQNSNSNTSQSVPDTIYRYQVFYPGQTQPAIDVSVNGQHKLDSVINNTFTGNRPQKKIITKTIVNDENQTN